MNLESCSDLHYKNVEHLMHLTKTWSNFTNTVNSTLFYFKLNVTLTMIMLIINVNDGCF